MKRILAGFAVAVSAFFIGISIQTLFRSAVSFLNGPKVEILTVEPVVTAPLFELPPEEIKQEEPVKVKFSFAEEGFYIPVKTRGLDEDTYFDFWMENEYRKLAPTAGIHTKSGYYEAKYIKLTQKHLSFTTEKIRGVEYKFEGRFLKDVTDESVDYKDTVLEGTIQKFKNGKKAFEIKTKFTFTRGC